MRGERTIAILAFLHKAAKVTAEILDTFTYAGYDESYRRARGLPSKIPRHRTFPFGDAARIAQERQKLSKLLYKLKKEGIIALGGRRTWHITARGIHYLDQKQRKDDHIGPPFYYSAASHEFTIVTYDVPESERKKRAWLRAALANMKFQRLQKSVWAGKVTIPEEFLKDAQQLRILPYIDIFVVTKGGTLKSIV